MRLPHAAAALLAALALALTACGGDNEAGHAPADRTPTPSASTSTTPGATPGASTSAGPKVRAASGKGFGGTGYTFHVPKGWADATARAKRLNKLVQVAASAKPDATGFATNINVVVSEAGVDVPTDEQLRQISAAIKSRLVALVPRLRINPTTTVAGQPALDHEGAATKSGVKYYIHQYVAFKGGKAYTITFSFGRGGTEAARSKVIGPVLASWTWS